MSDERRTPTKKTGRKSGAYLKKHTEALIKDLGYDAACRVSGRSKATLGRYFSLAPEHVERYMPIDVVAAAGRGSELSVSSPRRWAICTVSSLNTMKEKSPRAGELES